MAYAQRIGAQRHVFTDLKTLLACASPMRSGDALAGVAAESEAQRMAARLALADVPLSEFLHEALIDPRDDEVSQLILDQHDQRAFAAVSHLTVGGFRDWLLSDTADHAAVSALAWGLTPEMVAAVSKLMRNQDLIVAARKCQVVTRFRSTIGLPGHLAVRLQPNHGTDDARGIVASIIDGLMYGCGDAVIGINPVSDRLTTIIDLLKVIDEIRQRFEIPTQSCVLTHVTQTIRAIEQGAPVDLVFQSIGGTQKTNEGFGISLALLDEAHDAVQSLARGTVGRNAMYFEARAVRYRPMLTMAWTSRPARRGRMRWRAAMPPCSPIRWSASLALNICTTASRSYEPGLRTTSAASCWACPWAATCATPIMPKRTRTTWMACSRCWAWQG
jgi:ethanolamine ammonia-lyase large subunit